MMSMVKGLAIFRTSMPIRNTICRGAGVVGFRSIHWFKSGNQSHARRVAADNVLFFEAVSFRRLPVIYQQRRLSTEADEDDAGENSQVRLEWSPAFDKKLHEVIARCVFKV